jgi:transketolase
VEVRQVAAAVVDVPGPVYVRLKRGETPVIFEEDHVLRLGRAEVLVPGNDVALFASGMMLAAALAAARALAGQAISVSVINVPTIKPLDVATVQDAAARARIVVTAENHTIVGGLGSAVAETIAEAGLGRPLRRVGLRDTFAEGSLTAPYLFEKYGLSTQALIETIWSALGQPGPAPAAPAAAAESGEYSPV